MKGLSGGDKEGKYDLIDALGCPTVIISKHSIMNNISFDTVYATG